MKTLTLIFAVAMATFCMTAYAQQRTSTPQPMQMSAPVKFQNSQPAPQQNSQSTASPAPSKKTEVKKADKEEAAPAVDNKIAVSDAGTPGDKANSKKTSQPAEKKSAPTTGVSPK
ncbi:MAG: hypothetical protein HY063_07655 [Bacteroidetes bacterium]|nr:hypothetical protein [Bacteroidota bacterium]